MPYLLLAGRSDSAGRPSRVGVASVERRGSRMERCMTRSVPAARSRSDFPPPPCPSRQGEGLIAPDIPRADPHDAGGVHVGPGAGERALRLDGAARVVDHISPESGGAGLE